MLSRPDTGVDMVILSKSDYIKKETIVIDKQKCAKMTNISYAKSLSNILRE